MLRSKVASLEDEISKRKEETSQLESVVRERTAQMEALVGELELLQKVNVADDESVMKANTHTGLLEKQIERLGSDLEDQVRKGESLEARASEAEKSMHEFSRKLERAEKTNLEQRQKIQDLDDRLQHEQDKLSELENEANLKAEELAKVHGMWLPHWLAVRVELASAKWQVHGKPVLDPLMQKVAERSTHAQRLVKPHLQKAQDKLVPVAKKHLNSLRNTAVVLASAAVNSSSTVYRVCRDAIQPRTVKAQEFVGHCWQESKKFSRPYISQIVAASEPHLSRANVALEPYMRPVTSAWTSLVSSTSAYHLQVQKGVKRFLERNELRTPLSADKLAWFTASTLFMLPVFSVYKIFSVIIRRKNHAKKDRGRSKCRASTKRRVDK